MSCNYELITWVANNMCARQLVLCLNGNQALKVALEGVQQFPSGKGHLYGGSINLYRHLAQGTMAIVVGAVGYLEAWALNSA